MSIYCESCSKASNQQFLSEKFDAYSMFKPNLINDSFMLQIGSTHGQIFGSDLYFLEQIPLVN